jgi:hypothetical protein
MFQSFSKIWIIVAVAVFAVVGIFCWQYFESQKEIEILQEKIIETETETEKFEEQIENQAEITEADTSDWTIYRNEEYGFEVKYPSDANLFYGNFGFSYNYNGKINFSEDFEIVVYNNLDKLSLKEWVLSNEVCIYELEKALNNSAEEIKIAGLEAIKLSYPGGTCPMGASSILIRAYMSHNSKIYVFSVMADGGRLKKDTVEEERDEIFEKMLSSFRFLE